MGAGRISQQADTATPAVGQAALQTSLVTDPGEFMALRFEWNQLAAGSGLDTAFQRHEWVSAWWKAKGARTQLFVVLIRQGRELVGIAPLCIVEQRQGVLSFRRLQFLGASAGDYLDLLVGRERNRCIAALLAEIFRWQHLWDIFEVQHLRMDSRNRPILQEQLDGRWQQTASFVSPYMPVPLHPEQVLSKLPKGLRYELRRGMEKLSRKGPLKYEVFQSSRDALDALPPFFEMLKRREVGANRNGGQIARDWLRDYFTNLLSGPAHNLVHFSRLSVGKDPIAYHLGFQYENRLYWYKPTFDPDYAEFSPGKLLIHFAVTAAIEGGVKEVDFLLGNEPYKFQWTRLIREVADFAVFNSSLRSRVARHWYLHFKPVLKRSKVLTWALSRIRSVRARG